MISDDPDEDADSLDDDSILSDCVGGPVAAQGAPGFSGPTMDWPTGPSAEMRLTVDPATMDWFRRQSDNYAARMNLILKSWIGAHSRDTA